MSSNIETTLAKIDATITNAANAAFSAIVKLKVVVEKAVKDYRKAGLTDEQIAKRVRGLFKASAKANSVNKALRAAGVRQRGVRCDAGLTKTGGVRFFVGMPADDEDGDDDGDDEDGDGKDDKSVAQRLAEYALKLSGGNATKALAALQAAERAVKA